MRLPTRTDGERLVALRCKSKRGESLTTAERLFVSRMFNEYEEWYGVTEARVFNETVPPGSSARRDVRPEAYQYEEDPKP